MKITGFSTVRPEMASSRTYEDFSKFLGVNPARLGIVSSLYDQYTASHLTESLMNIYTRGRKPKDAFTSINEFMVEWGINVNFVKRVPFLTHPIGDGAQGTDIIFHFPENYYQRNDVFVIEESRQQIIVLSRPVRRSDGDWEVIGKIQDSDYNSVLDVDACQPGMTTRFLTNYHPEFHREGYVKYQSNVEKHRTYISLHRNDVSYSSKYRAMEDVFVGIGKGDGKDSVYYKMSPAYKDLLDNFMLSRNNGLMFGKTNVDANGHCKISDPETGEPLISGDGIMNQIERFALKYIFNKFNVQIFKTAMREMADRCEKPQGNTWVFVMNTAMHYDAQDVLERWIKDFKTDGAFVYSRGANGMVDLGATYQSFSYNGNTVILKVDKSLDIEFPSKKVAMCIDLTPGVNGQEALKMFTFKGGQCIHNVLYGPGRKSGLESGEVSTPVAGGKEMMHGWAGTAVLNPYRSVILMSE